MDIMMYTMSIRAGIIIRYNDKYLCVFQKASKLWGFPKGRLNYFEPCKVGASRELLEETGILVIPEHLLDEEMIHIKRGKHHHFYYIVDTDTLPAVRIDNYEISDYKWLSISELLSVRVSFFTEQVIKRLIFGLDKYCNVENKYLKKQGFSDFYHRQPFNSYYHNDNYNDDNYNNYIFQKSIKENIKDEKEVKLQEEKETGENKFNYRYWNNWKYKSPHFFKNKNNF